MAIEITVPRLGWSAEEAAFAIWLKADGEQVKAGEALFVLEGDKSTQEIESMDSGTLSLLANSPKGGDVVKVGQLIGYLLAVGEKAPNAGILVPAASVSVAPAAVVTGQAVYAPVASPVQARTTSPAVTPRARRASENSCVNLAEVEGTGKDGRIRERDVIAATPKPPLKSTVPAVTESGGAVISVMRRTIADRMMQSLAQTAPVTLTTRIDATNLVALRNQFKASKESHQVPAYTDIIAKLSASAIQRHPNIMGQWREDRIVTPEQIHIGIAVDTEFGLLVPVIRDVPHMTLAEVARTSRELIQQAQTRKLKAESQSGGVFTITNLGGFGIDAFTPILNFPETAILGLGAIRRVPAVVNGNIVVRDEMTLSLTFDHRVVDGAPAARFLQTLVQGIENPAVWLLETVTTGDRK